MTVKFTNNASTTVATAINTTATSLVVTSAAGFPALSGSGDYCYLTIQQAAGTVREVVKATALSTNTFTIERAQDGTSAGSWSVSDVVELRVTAALLTDIVDAATHDSSVLSVDSTNNRVGVNDTTPSVTLDISGTDAIALPVGTTAQRPSGSAGRFRYNSSLSQFEGYTDAWGAIGGGGTNTFTTDTFTANGSLVAFNLSQTVSSENNLLVFIDGVFQTQDAYSIATASGTTTLTFSAAPANGNRILIYSVAAAVSGSNLNIDSMTGDGSDTTLALSIAPVNENNTQVFVDGVYQSKSNYSISGTTLTFSTAPPNGSAVEVMTMTQTDINVPVDGTITSAKLSGDLVTPGALDVTGTLLVGTDSGDSFNFHSKLRMQNDNHAYLQIKANSAKQAGVLLGDTDDDFVGGMIYDNSDNSLRFNSGDSERMRITSAGELLVGVTSAGATGLSLANSYNLSFSEGSNLSFANVFRQATSGAAVIGSGYKYSSTGNLMASSHSSAWSRTAISAGYNAIRFFADAESTIAVGTDITPTEKMRITSAGVGIGTISPNATLEVASGTGNTDAGTNSPTIRITNDTQSADWDPDDVIGTLEFQLDDGSGNAPYDAAFIKTVNDVTNGTLASGALTFGTATYNTAGGAVERMRITSTGSARFNLSSTLSPESNATYKPLFIGSTSQMSQATGSDYYWVTNGYYAADGTYRAINNGHMVGGYTVGNGQYVIRRSSASVSAGGQPTWVNSMTITPDGIVRKHDHPAFNAYNPAVTSSGDIIICGATRLNQGNNFSTTTGAFTAPVAGVYHFTFAILVSATGSPDYHRILFEINTSGTSTTYGDTLEEQAGSSYSSAVMSITIYLNQNDYIRIRNQGAATFGTNYGSFSGHLVG